MGEPYEKKISIIFPGMGYHIDKPLLYYAKDMVALKDYEYHCVEYGELFQENIKDNLREYIKEAVIKVEKQLNEIDFLQYNDVIFISKSIGSVIAAEYIKSHNLIVRQIIYTPIQATLSYELKDCIVFHGTKDLYCKTEDLENCCAENHSTLYILEGANHSLETESTILNLVNLKFIMEKTRDFIED